MSDNAQPPAEAKGEGTPAAQPQDPPKPTESQPETPPPAAAKPGEEEEPAWLPKRLEQAQRAAQTALLKELGIDSSDAAKAQLAELKELKQAQLSDQEKMEQRLAELEPAAARTQALEESLAGYAERELSALTEAQQTAVKGLAGDDPAKVLSTIESLRPTWAQAAPETPSKPEEPPPAPATTGHAGGPPATGKQSPPDLAAEYARLRKENPFAAAQLLKEHGPAKVSPHP